jgi:hypothetical protein
VTWLKRHARAEHWRHWFSSASYIGLPLVITVFIWWSLSTGIQHPSAGPLVKIEDLAATRRNDGTYIYPILIRNTGDQPMLNRDALFYQLISTKRLSPAQEDHIYVSRIGKAFTSPGQEENYRRRTSAETPDDFLLARALNSSIQISIFPRVTSINSAEEICTFITFS